MASIIKKEEDMLLHATRGSYIPRRWARALRGNTSTAEKPL